MAQPFDVCIRGAGIVGRVLALLLARERLRVALVEQPPRTGEAHSDVRAYALNATSRALLQDLRCWPEAHEATAVARMEVQGDDGGVVQFSAALAGTEALAWIVDVPALERRLAEAVRYQPLIETLVAPAQPAASLWVVCEGRASQTREALGVVFDRTPYAQQAIAARVQCAQPHGQVARQWFAEGQVLAFLPLGGADGNSVAVVWSVEFDHAERLLHMPAAEFNDALSQASQQMLGDVMLSSLRAAWPLQLAQAQRWCGTVQGQPWVLAGDAAHTVHPLAGQGLNLGLADVAELARVLRERDYWRSVADLRLLRQYERARKAGLASMALATHSLHSLFAHPTSGWQTLRNWGMNGFDRSVLLKTWVARRAMGLN